MIPGISSAFANHLWQSTLVLVAAALLNSILQRNRARVRFGVWLAASTKFLVPFAALVAVGRQFGVRTATATTDITFIIEAIGQPFSVSSAVTTSGRTSSILGLK